MESEHKLFIHRNLQMRPSSKCQMLTNTYDNIIQKVFEKNITFKAV